MDGRLRMLSYVDKVGTLRPYVPDISTVEMNDHLLQCSDPDTLASRSCILLESIDILHQSNTPPPLLLLNTLHYKWSLVLALPSPVIDQESAVNGIPFSLLQVIKHQNMLGWDNMLRGYTSIYWLRAYNDCI
jgi:hypothetical protein